MSWSTKDMTVRQRAKLTKDIIKESTPSTVTVSTIIKGVLFSTEPMRGAEAVHKFLSHKPTERNELVGLDLVGVVEFSLTNQNLTLSIRKGRPRPLKDSKSIQQQDDEPEEEQEPEYGVHPITGKPFGSEQAMQDFVAGNSKYFKDELDYGPAAAKKKWLERENRFNTKSESTEYGRNSKNEKFVPKKFVPLSEEARAKLRLAIFNGEDPVSAIEEGKKK